MKAKIIEEGGVAPLLELCDPVELETNEITIGKGKLLCCIFMAYNRCTIVLRQPVAPLLTILYCKRTTCEHSHFVRLHLNQ